MIACLELFSETASSWPPHGINGNSPKNEFSNMFAHLFTVDISYILLLCINLLLNKMYLISIAELQASKWRAFTGWLT